MPDLKSELQKLKDLKFDDEPETNETPTPQTSAPEAENNLTRQVFLWYKANPASTVAECVAGTGLTNTAVSARTAQLFGRNVLVRSKTGGEVFRYTTNIDDMPDRQTAVRAALIKANAAKQSKQAQRAILAKARAAKKAKAAAKAKAPPAPAPDTFSAAMMVSRWTPFQARAVYDELKKLFAGV